MILIIHGTAFSTRLTPKCCTYLQENIKTTENLFLAFNNKTLPSNIYNSIKYFFKKENNPLIIAKLEGDTLYSKTTKNYKILFTKKLNLTSEVLKTQVDSSIVRIPHKPSKRKSSKRNNNSCSYKPTHELDFKNAKYGTASWFDAFYSDENWSPNDIKLGID